jgi:hypothetical protein
MLCLSFVHPDRRSWTLLLTTLPRLTRCQGHRRAARCLSNVQQLARPRSREPDRRPEPANRVPGGACPKHLFWTSIPSGQAYLLDKHTFWTQSTLVCKPAPNRNTSFLDIRRVRLWSSRLRLSSAKTQWRLSRLSSWSATRTASQGRSPTSTLKRSPTCVGLSAFSRPVLSVLGLLSCSFRRVWMRAGKSSITVFR